MRKSRHFFFFIHSCFPCSPRAATPICEKSIYSEVVELSVAVYSSFKDILICVYDFWRCHGNLILHVGRVKNQLSVLLILYIFSVFLIKCRNSWISTFNKHFGLIFSTDFVISCHFKKRVKFKMSHLRWRIRDFGSNDVFTSACTAEGYRAS